MTRSRRLGAHALRGLAMGAADLVPGVSGGTIALVLGIYERLLGAVRDGAAALAALLRADVRGSWRRLVGIEWNLVGPVLAGIVVAVVSLAAVLTHLLAEHPVEMSAVFFGLIVGSVIVTVRDVRRWDLRRLAVGTAAAAATFALLGLRGAPLADPGSLTVFGSGAVAISGMILPGVSGAFILLVIGVYEATLAAVTGRDLAFIAVFGGGAVTGLALFGSALKWLLERYHDTMMAALIGLMGGSLRVLWPWPGAEVGDPRLGAPVVDDLPVTVVGAIVATIVVYVLGTLGRPPEVRSGVMPDADSGPPPPSAPGPHDARGVWRQLTERWKAPVPLDLAAPLSVALGIVVTLGVLRVWAPSVLRAADAPGTVGVAAFAAIPFVVALAAAPAAIAVLGARTVALASAALLIVGRFALPATGGGELQLAFATTAAIGGLTWLAAVAGGAVPRRAAAIGVVAGIALDAALMVGLRSIDLVWQTGAVATVAGGGILAVFAASAIASPPERAELEGRVRGAPVWAWMAVGPALACTVAVASPTRLGAVTGLDGALAGGAVLAGHLVAVLAAIAVARTPTPLQGPVAAGLIALGLGGAIAARMPFETPPILAASTALLIAGLGVAVARSLTSGGHRTAAVRAAATVVGLALGAAAVATHHLIHDVNALVIAAALVAGAALLTVRDRATFAPIAGARVALATVALAAAVGVAAHAAAPPPPAPGTPGTLPMRVAGHHLDGALDRDGRIALDRLTRTIAAERPDVVAVQGVDRGRFAAGGVDVLPHLAERLGMAPLYAPAASEQLGLALLVRHGVLDSRTEPLPSAPGVPDAAALLAVVDLGGDRGLTVLTTHLHGDLGASGIRGQQAARVGAIADDLVDRRTPVVVIGDLGAPPLAAELGALRRSLSNLSRESPPTSPAHDPTDVRQQVLVSADLVGRQLTVRPEVISDHLMVAVTVDLME